MRSFYYIGLEEQNSKKAEKKEKCQKRREKNLLPIYRCGKKLFFGKEEIVLYYSLLPADFLKEIRKKRKKKQWEKRISQAVAYAETALFCRSYEVLFGEKMVKEQEISPELFGACLAERKRRASGKLSELSLSFPAESSTFMTENAVTVLMPFLSELNRVVFVGEETEDARQIEDFLFWEYGLIMVYEKRPAKRGVWLDFDKNSYGSFGNFAIENGIYHLNSAEVLKFLDTMAKNGYNTKVN